MTTRVYRERTQNEIDLDGVIDETTGIEYIGKARHTMGDTFVCLARVGNALCRVAVSITEDTGDERHRGGGHAMSTVRMELSDDDLKEAVTDWLYKKTHLNDWEITLGTKVVSLSMRGDDEYHHPQVFATRAT